MIASDREATMLDVDQNSFKVCCNVFLSGC